MPNTTAGAVLACLTLFACGTRDPSPGLDGSMGRDGSIGRDAGPFMMGDGGDRLDAGPRPDAPPSPEVCTGGLDEDADARTDCDDDDCWSLEACASEHVAGVVAGLVPCGDPIERTAEEALAACARTMPTSTMTPTRCAPEIEIEATIRVYCTSAGEAGAVWIEERASTPNTTRMLSERRFEHTYYERQSVIDWERYASGITMLESTVSPLHEAGAYGGERALHRVVTVRPVHANGTIARLLGYAFIVSLVDLDAPMSMDTRMNVRVGAVEAEIAP
jgi:hypothetical protein